MVVGKAQADIGNKLVNALSRILGTGNDGVDAKNGALREVDDGGKHLYSIVAQVAHGERGSFRREQVGIDAAFLAVLRYGLQRVRELDDIHLVGILYCRHHKSTFGVDSQAQVYFLEKAHSVAQAVTVGVGELLQRFHGSIAHKVVDGDVGS